MRHWSFAVFSLSCFLFGSTCWACDLNHDWEVFKTETIHELKPHVFLKAVLEHFGPQKKPILILDVKDLFQKAKMKPRILENSLLSYGFDLQGEQGLFFRNPAQVSRQDLFNPETLKKWIGAQEFSRLISLKLTRYATVLQRSKDRYIQNKNVYRESRFHDLEFSYAILSPEGRYLDFQDVELRIEEVSTFQEMENGKRVMISLKGFDPPSELWKDENYFLGMEGLQGLPMTVLKSLGLVDP